MKIKYFHMNEILIPFIKKNQVLRKKRPFGFIRQLLDGGNGKIDKFISNSLFRR